MVFGIDDALVAGSLAAGALGGSKKGGSSQQASGYQAWPTKAKNFAEGDVLDAIMQQLHTPYPTLPTMRAANPANDPFASQALWDLQQYSDQSPNGLFAQPQQPQTPGNGPSPDVLAQQYLAMMMQPGAGGTRGYYMPGNFGGWSGDAASGLQGQINGGQLSLSQLGDALGAQGYGKTAFTPQQINYTALLEALK
jgi:hypothetical protein